MAYSDDLFAKNLEAFTGAAKRAIEASHCTSSIDVANQKYWASVLLVRVCSVAISILLVCPRSVLNERGLSWDFASVAALCRSLFEAILMLFYLGLEAISGDEWKLRITLVHLADCTERIRLFHHIDDQENTARFVLAASDLRAQLLANPAFDSIRARQRSDFLSGERYSLFGKAEIIRRANEDPDDALYFYRFLSNHMHSLPFGFHRTGEHQRNGEENDVDKGYAGLALGFAQQWLNKALGSFESAFSDVATFGTYNFDFRRLTSPALGSRDEALVRKIFSTGVRGI